METDIVETHKRNVFLHQGRPLWASRPLTAPRALSEPRPLSDPLPLAVGA